MNRAIFLDRDGTLNYDSRDYIKNLAEFRLFPFTVPALAILQRLGYKLVVITNQACIGRGLTTTEAVEAIHSFMHQELSKSGIFLDRIYYCPHLKEERCNCRKPAIGNVLKATAELQIDLERSYFIGDTPKDVATGKRAGCRTIQVATGVWDNDPGDLKPEEIEPDFKTDDLLKAAELIARLESSVRCE
jgi:histidinol-phosphate phosphatase family protein